MTKLALGLCALALCGGSGSCASFGHNHVPKSAVTLDDRIEILRRAQVWKPTNVGALDVRNGPKGPGAFARGQTVRCDYVERDMHGRSPKFKCVIPGQKPDEVKVKYGLDNAEVYGEVISTRLLWVLGFGADRMYPVRIICRGCPDSIEAASILPTGERVIDPAVIERKVTGWDVESRSNEGWSWPELDKVDPTRGGAPLAHRDAMKLLAVMIQHSDSKPDQQRLICLDAATAPKHTPDAHCARPFMLIQDLGLTFGRTDFFYRDVNYVNLERWTKSPIWAGSQGCVGNITAPVFGTLERPVISETGRAFLANLLRQLRDSQIHDLFDAARVSLRVEGSNHEAPSVEDWVSVFKQKRQEITDRRCPPLSLKKG